MPKLRVHNFAISLDGYGADRTRIAMSRSASAAKRCTTGLSSPERFSSMSERRAARRASMTISRRAGSITSERSSWDATCSGRSADLGPTTAGRGGGATTRPITPRPSCSPTTRGHRSSWTAAPPFTSSPRAFTLHCDAPPKLPMGKNPAYGWGLDDPAISHAGLIDEMHFAIAPILLGSGEHLFGGIDTPKLGYRCTEHVTTANAMHVVLTKGS